jgi:acetolactate synthase-1/3 small subunit
MTGDEHLELELALVKVRAGGDAAALAPLTEPFDVITVSRDGGLQTLRFLGPGEALNRFVADLEAAGRLVELVRSGAVTITPGAEGLRYRRTETGAETSFP